MLVPKLVDMNASHSTYQLSSRAENLPGSPIRALLSAHRGEGTLDLGGGIPDPELFPAEWLGAAAEQLLRNEAHLSLQYASTSGVVALRDWIRERLSRRGFEVKRSQIIITHGSQQAIATVAQALVSSGDPVLLETPVYPGAMQAFAFAEGQLASLPVTRDGWDLSILNEISPRIAYVISHHQNPTGRCATDAAKQGLAERALSQGFYLLEDDAYGELDFANPLTRPLVADCPNRGILVGSFSKTFCPGLRVGYIVCPETLSATFERVLQTLSLQPGTLTQHLLLRVLETIDYDAHLTALRTRYALRAQALSARLTALGVKHQPAQGGFFHWAEVSGSASQFAKASQSLGLIAIPEAAFSSHDRSHPDRHVRLAFSRYKDDPLSIERLRGAFRGQDVLYRDTNWPAAIAQAL